MNETQEQFLYSYLKELDIEIEKREHEAFFTCETSGSFYEENAMGADCKNLFLRNRNGKNHFLVVLLSHKKLDISAFAESISEHKKMSFASNERLKKYLGLTPGSVTPFGLLHENAKNIEVFIDQEIFKHKKAHFHPLRNTATVSLFTSDFKNFINSLSQKVVIREFTE